MDPIKDRLVLDMGNSRTKLGHFSGGRLVRHGTVPNGDTAALRGFLGDRRVDAIVVGSVGLDHAELMKALASIAPLKVITGRSRAHLRNGYGTPETLGADRWANAVGASLLFPRRAVLAISLGTCAIYDLVDAEGTYRGGLISPGLQMRAQAMHAFTARLPLVDTPEPTARIGLSTEECITAGAHHGLRAELTGTIAEFRQQHPGLAVVLTGGDAVRYARALENGIFAHPFLTLFGLHAISLSDSQATPAPAAD